MDHKYLTYWNNGTVYRIFTLLLDYETYISGFS